MGLPLMNTVGVELTPNSSARAEEASHLGQRFRGYRAGRGLVSVYTGFDGGGFHHFVHVGFSGLLLRGEYGVSKFEESVIALLGDADSVRSGLVGPGMNVGQGKFS